jgi:hypothetical protein
MLRVNRLVRPGCRPQAMVSDPNGRAAVDLTRLLPTV